MPRTEMHAVPGPVVPTCPQCGASQVFLIVPMADDNPWNWFRCPRCDSRFTPTTEASIRLP